MSKQITCKTKRGPKDIDNASQKPIRILFISHDTGMFGAQRTLLTLISAIDRKFFTPILVIPRKGTLGNDVAGLGIPVFVKRLIHWVPSFNMSPVIKRLFHFCRFIFTLPLRSRSIERLITENDIDIVYTNTVTCVEGAIGAWRTGKPHIWHIHEPILRNSELCTILPYPIYTWVINFLSKTIIFCSKSVANDYPQFSRKASIVYNGLPFPPIRDRSNAREELARKINIDSGVKLVAVVGALQPRKDHMTFLAAAKQAGQNITNAVFLIVGTGGKNYTNHIYRRIKELHLDSKVMLIGWWKDDIHDLLAAIDILVISSEQESFGLTAIEALSMETPVVATRCGGPEEIIRDGDTGLLVPVKDSFAMADAIMKLLQDEKLARRLGAEGRKHVSEQFSVDRYVHGIQNTIQETVTQKISGKIDFYSRNLKTKRG